jgi:hypothetical protein
VGTGNWQLVTVLQYLDADHFLVLYFPVLTSILLAVFRRRSFVHNAITIGALALVAVMVVSLRFSATDLSRSARVLAGVLALGQVGALLIASRAPVFERHPVAFVVAGPFVFWTIGLLMVGIWFGLGLPL